MNEWFIYIALLLCIVVHPKRFTIIWGRGGGGLSSITISVQHPLGWCDGCHKKTAQCAHHTPATGGEDNFVWKNDSHFEMFHISDIWINVGTNSVEKCASNKILKQNNVFLLHHFQKYNWKCKKHTIIMCLHCNMQQEIQILSIITPKTSFIFRTQIKIILMKSESCLNLHRQQSNWHMQGPER